jgi:hypothetical protein
MAFKSLLLASTLALSALAVPVPAGDCSGSGSGTGAISTPVVTPTDGSMSIMPVAKVQTPGVTADDLVAIAPETASCSGAPFPDECADASTAAKALNASFAKYNIATPGEQAALIAYMLFESGNFKYSKNHFPGRPGQGTRMMAMPNFVGQYAAAVADPTTMSTASTAGVDAVLALVNSDDEKSFGAAAWFYSSQCDATVKAGVQAETVDGWHAFLTQCVGTTAAPERDTPWVAAKQILLGKQA